MKLYWSRDPPTLNGAYALGTRLSNAQLLLPSYKPCAKNIGGVISAGI